MGEAGCIEPHALTVLADEGVIHDATSATCAVMPYYSMYQRVISQCELQACKSLL